MSFLLGFAPKCRSRAFYWDLLCQSHSLSGSSRHPSVLLPPFSALPKRSCPSCSLLGCDSVLCLELAMAPCSSGCAPKRLLLHWRLVALFDTERPWAKILWSKSIQLKLHGIWRQVLHTQRCSDVVTDWRQHILTNCSCHLRTWHFFQALHLLCFASCLPSLLGFFVLAGLACKEAKIVRYSTIVLLKSYWALAALAVWVLHPVFDPAWSKEEFTMTAVTLDHDQPINQWLLRMLHSAATQAIHAIAASLWMAFCQWSLLEVRNGFELSAPQDSSRRWTVSA